MQHHNRVTNLVRQANHGHLRLYEPILDATEELRIDRLSGHEALSLPFAYEVAFHSENDAIELEKVLGREMAIGLELPSGGERFFHGYVTSFSLVDLAGTAGLYRAILRPHLWRLTQQRNCRIFQNVSVLDIAKALLAEHDVANVEIACFGERGAPHLPWEYCVQYRESDFAFLSRLLEHEGIHYYFQHHRDKHTLVLTDSVTHHSSVPDYQSIPYYKHHRGQGIRRSEQIWGWKVSKNVVPGRYAVGDFDYRVPSSRLHRSSGSDLERKYAKALEHDYEVYDNPETIVQKTGYSAEVMEDYARMRIEELHARYEVVSANTDARGLCAGAVFSIANSSRKDTKDRRYLVTCADVAVSQDVRRSAARLEGGHGTSADADAGEPEGPSSPVSPDRLTEPNIQYECSFEAVDTTQPYRPSRSTPKPVIHGVQSATVVGAGKVATDEQGRVKVKFHWDRSRGEEETSSCWVRVSQVSAGSNWGSMFVPHVGHEVLVSFEEGDPDRPVVVGRVYNGENKPPLPLPASEYRSILRDHFGNEIIFDGTPGSEHLSMYTPSKKSALVLGKSAYIGVRGGQTTVADGQLAFYRGDSGRFTKGLQFVLDQGFVFTVRCGVNMRCNLGADFKLIGGIYVEGIYGGRASFVAGPNVSFSKGAEVRLNSNDIRHVAKGHMLLWSERTAHLCGGSNDNTMLTSDDEALRLTFDSSSKGLAGDFDELNGKAQRKSWGMLGGLLGTGALSAVVSSKIVGKEQEYEVGSIDWREFLSDFATLALPPAMWLNSLAPWTKKTTTKADQLPAHTNPSAKLAICNETMALVTGQRGPTGPNAKAPEEDEPGIHLVAGTDGGSAIRLLHQGGAAGEIQITANNEPIKITAPKNVEMETPELVLKGKLKFTDGLKSRYLSVLGDETAKKGRKKKP